MMTRRRTSLSLRWVAQILVSVNFVYELQDKILRFDHWKRIIETSGVGRNGFGSMVLVVVLLTVGCTLLLVGSYSWIGRVCLATVQIPTSILFETNYERFDAASALGGVVACALWESNEELVVGEDDEWLQEENENINVNTDPDNDGGRSDAALEDTTETPLLSSNSTGQEECLDDNGSGGAPGIDVESTSSFVTGQ